MGWVFCSWILMKQWRGNCSLSAAVSWVSCSSSGKYWTLESSLNGTGSRVGISACASVSLEESPSVLLPPKTEESLVLVVRLMAGPPENQSLGWKKCPDAWPPSVACDH